MGTHPIFESDFDCLTEKKMADTDPVVDPTVDDEIEEDIPEPTPIPLKYQSIAYSALLIMALLPIWLGSKRALANRKKRLQDIADGKTAIFEPLLAPKLKFIFPGLCEDAEYQLTFKENKKNQFDIVFSRRSLLVVACAGACGGAYLYNQHWLANNIIGLCFAIQGVEMLSLPNYKTGCMLLGGLFFYDVFWVFGTDVMVTVAKKFDAPIKLVFPANIFDAASKSSMLGLGDIVIPGILIALVLRFDDHKKPGSSKYFITTFIAYILGLAGTIVVMHVFKHAQPALLYLVPACLGAPLLVALFSGELTEFFEYNEEEEEEEEDEEEDEKKEK